MEIGKNVYICKMLYTEIKHRIQEIKSLTKLGLISPIWLRDLELFETYTFYINEGASKQEAYKQTATDYNISWQSVKVIAKKMQS